MKLRHHLLLGTCPWKKRQHCRVPEPADNAPQTEDQLKSLYWMKFEQPKHLNRFVDESIPMTWNYRWRMLKILAPILALGGVMLIEMVLLRALLDGLPPAVIIQRLLIGCFGFVALGMLFVESKTRSYHSSKRVLEVDEKAIKLQHSDRGWRIPWGCLLAVLVEPIPGEPALAKLNVTGTLNKKAITPRTFSIVMNRTEQLPRVLSEFQVRHQLQGCFTIRELQAPLPRRATRRSPSIWRYWLGTLLMLHGMLITGLAFVDQGDRPEPTRPARKFSPAFERSVRDHFKSSGELRRFFLVTGGVLAGGGLLLAIWGGRSISRHRKERDEETRKEIEDACKQPGTVIAERR